MWTIALPLSIETSKTKRMALNLNVYRNMHFQVLNKAKSNFSNKILPTLKSIPVQHQISLHYVLYLPTQRRTDISNVCSIVDKFFSDTLVEAGVIVDDSYDYLGKVTFEFGGIDRINPRVEVHIEPVKEEKTMRIILTQKDLQTALKSYISSKIVIQEGQNVSVELTEDGAEVILSESSVVAEEPVKEEAPVKRTRRTKAEIEAARAEEEEEVDTVTQKTEEEPDVKEAEQPEEDEKEVAEETTEAAPVRKTLFGTMNRPKN